MLRPPIFVSSRLRPRLANASFLPAAAAVAGAMLLFAAPLAAQDSVTPTPADAAPALDVAGLEARLAAIEADTGIDDAVKASLRPKYQEAIAALKDADKNAAKAAAYRDALKTAPGQTADLQAKLRTLSSAENTAEVTASGSTAELQKEVESRRIALAELKTDLDQATTELARVKSRPIEIGARLPQARSELAKIKEQLASPDFAANATSPGRVADRIVLQAAQSKLASELEMLEQEQLSQSPREGLLEAESDLLTRQVANAGASLDALTVLVNRRLASEARQVVSQAGTAEGVAGDDKQTQALATAVQALAKEFEEVVGRLKEVSAEHDKITARKALLTREYAVIREQLSLGAASGSIVRALFVLREQLSSPRALALQTKELRASLGETRLAALRVEEKIGNQAAVEKQFAAHGSDAVTRLLATRREVLAKLQSQYANLVRAMAALESDQVQYAEKASAVRANVQGQLFWVRSSPPVSASTLTDIPPGLKWLFSANHWVELENSLSDAVVGGPLFSGAIAIVLGALLFMRRWLRAALKQSGAKVRRISTDRYIFTGKALLYTALLALPVPILVFSATWALGQAANPSAWLREITRGLWLSGLIASALAFLAEVCRRGGLGEAHFGWPEAAVRRLRRATFWFGIIYIPALLVTAGSIVGDSSLIGQSTQYLHSVGRISFILAHVWAVILLWKLLRPRDGILASFVHGHPGSLIARLRYLWFPLVIASPVALVGLALLGYLYSAIALSLELCVTLAVVAGGAILYALVLRWFTIPERKLALAEALAERRARQEASATLGDAEESGEVVSVELDEEKLDLTAIGQQTRQLLRFLFALGVLFAVGLLWSQTVPIFSALDKVHPVGGLSLLSLSLAALIIVVTLTAANNLPGLLELAVLRATKAEAGTRTAIITLCQYAVIAIGLALLFNVLNVDWAKFGWIAAALSVGLGFGLQEVVANFVCGIILLFERPIRVGDVVTVEGTTGTVTKIHMRATTIMNWDRQEFVVPNKNLITGTLLNWTLSTSLSRILITVGVAYGSDTAKARQILLAVAADNPRVLDDPAPLASFEEFADSSLTLRLRAYLPNVDDRIKTITELHAEIDKRFAEAGIEIAFPQRDLHLRSGWEGADRSGLKGGSGEKTEGK